MFGREKKDSRLAQMEKNRRSLEKLSDVYAQRGGSSVDAAIAALGVSMPVARGAGPLKD